MHLHVLCSGSKGNAAVIENAQTGEGVLVDCGLCARDFFKRCDQAGFDVNKLRCILITHEHSDHTKNVGVILRGLAKRGIHVPLVSSVPVLCASNIIRKEHEANPDLVELRSFKAGDALSVAGMQVHVLPTSHDAAESFGFRFETNESALGFVTDTGTVLPAAHEGLQDVDILALESNHDVRMLREGPYPYILKQRVASNQGHLSNDQAALELESLLSPRLKQVVAMHISQNNNTYPLPEKTLQEILTRNGHPATAQSAFQDRLVSI